jgi:dolichol-phosphate mannosyltransferase
VLRNVHLECRRFEFCPEVTAKLRLQGIRIHEVPIRYNARGIGAGKKIRARDGFEAWWTLLKYRLSPLARREQRLAAIGTRQI